MNDSRYLSQALFLGQLAENALAETSAAFRKVIADSLEPGRFIDLHMRTNQRKNRGTTFMGSGTVVAPLCGHRCGSV